MVPNDLATVELTDVTSNPPQFPDHLPAEFQVHLETCKKAAAIAEAERNKATGVIASLVAAKLAADADRDLVTKAKVAAEVDRDLAAKAKVAAESERDLTAQARASADAAKMAAEAERDQASQAKGPAIAARVETESARDLAVQASTAADAAKSATVNEFEQATQARVAAEVAKEAAEAGRSHAIEASAAASEAKTATETERDKAIKARTEIDAAKVATDTALGKAISAADKAESEAERAARAHNLSTTAGLAGAFNEKALKAKERERFWTITLIGALIVAAVIGWFRYEDLKSLMGAKPELAIITAELLLALLAIGAPVWLAWMATRMISKNLAIAEDYAYKASLAKAYIGFRQEARGLDPLLEQRLFAAAITQLDSSPVRFLDDAHPGSPLQDLLQQPFMITATQDAGFKQKLLEWIQSRCKVNLTPASKSSPTNEVS